MTFMVKGTLKSKILKQMLRIILTFRPAVQVELQKQTVGSLKSSMNSLNKNLKALKPENLASQVTLLREIGDLANS